MRNAGFIGIFFPKHSSPVHATKNESYLFSFPPPPLYSFSSLLFFEGLEWGGGDEVKLIN